MHIIQYLCILFAERAAYYTSAGILFYLAVFSSLIDKGY